ncbi:MAG TPA: hypothetical protein VMU37_09330, partial [Caulobacteraceae bacterium]|nr:hypothetical protein [Caulobacteraceae bacterium]
MLRSLDVSLPLALTLGLTAAQGAVPSVQAANDRAWGAWRGLTHRSCPAAHVEWLYGATYPYLYDGFNASLSAGTRQRVERAAATARNCASETVGHSCELGNFIRSYQ